MRCIRSHVKMIAMAFAAALLAACGSSNSDRIKVVTIGDAKDPFAAGIRLAMSGQLVRASTKEGLVAFDEQGRVIPALADRWIVTDDGKSYIFRLRDGTWRDGSHITSESARKALRDALAALRGTSLGLDLAGIEEIRAMAGRVVEFRLTQPMPHFLHLLAQPELGMVHDGKGAGPMVMERKDDIASLAPIDPQTLGLPAIRNWEERARTVDLWSVSGEEAIELFNQGDVDLVLGGKIEDFTRTGSVGILRGTIQVDPVIGLFGLSVMNEKGFLAEPGNREAIAMAIDRQGLIAPLGIDGWTSSTRIVTPKLDGDTLTIGERWAGMTIEDRRSIAASRVAAFRGNQGNGKEVALRIWLPEGPGADVLFERLKADFAKVGLRAIRARNGEAADLRLVDDVARYPRAEWFLNRLNCKSSRALCAPIADRMVADAKRILNPAAQNAVLAEAEADLTLANVFIPFGTPIRWSLVRSNINAFAPNQWGWHPLMPLAVLPK